MKYTNSIVLGALLGTLSQIEYADAIRLTSDSQLEVTLAKEHKKKHHKHHKKSKKNDLIQTKDEPATAPTPEEKSKIEVVKAADLENEAKTKAVIAAAKEAATAKGEVKPVEIAKAPVDPAVVAAAAAKKAADEKESEEAAKPDSAKSDEEKAAETAAAVDSLEKKADSARVAKAEKKAAKKAAQAGADADKAAEEEQKKKDTTTYLKSKVDTRPGPSGAVEPKEEPTADVVAKAKLDATVIKSVTEAKAEMKEKDAQAVKEAEAKAKEC